MATISDIEILPLSPVGAEVRGLNLSQETPESVKERLRTAFDEHALLLFRDQHLVKEDLLRTARIFGKISEQGDAPGGFNYVSNVSKPGLNENMEFTIPGSGDGELLFHFDHCFQEHPLKAILLYGLEIPPVGGDTRFSDVRLATDRLPEKIRQRIEGHDIRHKSAYRDPKPEGRPPHHVSAPAHRQAGAILQQAACKGDPRSAGRRKRCAAEGISLLRRR